MKKGETEARSCGESKPRRLEDEKNHRGMAYYQEKEDSYLFLIQRRRPYKKIPTA